MVASIGRVRRAVARVSAWAELTLLGGLLVVVVGVAWLLGGRRSGPS